MSSSPLAAPSPVESGGRLELRLAHRASGESEGPTYAVRWFSAASGEDPEGELESGEGEARVQLEPLAVSFTWQSPPPSWLEELATALLRTTAKGLGAKPWPRRLTRWREPPRRPK